MLNEKGTPRFIQCNKSDVAGRVRAVVGFKPVTPFSNHITIVFVEVVVSRWFRKHTAMVELYQWRKHKDCWYCGTDRDWYYSSSGRRFPLSERVEQMFDAWKAANANDQALEYVRDDFEGADDDA